MERSWLGAESMMQKCDTKEFYLVKKSILKNSLHKLELSEKDTQSELKGVLFQGMHVPQKTANRDLNKYKNL